MIEVKQEVEEVAVLTIPLTYTNIMSLALIVVLTIIGTLYVWILSTKKHCRCRLCTKEVVLQECIGEGGFGAVFIVENKDKKRFILKKLEMKELNELEKVQYEAKQLRML